MSAPLHSLAAALLLVLSPVTLHAELPGPIKHMADQYDAGMKSYDVAIQTQQKLATDAYLATLETERKRAVTTKRPVDLAAIDAELAAMKAGPLPAQAPAGLPQWIATNRTAYLAAMERATTTVDRARRNARESYLTWLTKLEAAVKGRDKTTEDAVASERKRITPPDGGGAK